MEKYGVIFAGQGAQYTGMGQDFYLHNPILKGMYETASSLLGFNLADLCFTENELLNQTKYTQPAILMTSIAIYETFKRKFDKPISGMMGFSLGEYSALYASGIFDFATILNLVKKRAQYMDECSQKKSGCMVAIINNDLTKVLELVKEFDGVWVANYNSPRQIVVSGKKEAIEQFKEKAKNFGIKRMVTLTVSGAFHSPLMEEAKNRLYLDLQKNPSSKPEFPLYLNRTGKVWDDLNNLPKVLSEQVTFPVLFEPIIRQMIQDGITTFIEIGPGTVLSGLVRQIDVSVKVIAINKYEDLRNLEVL